MPGTCSAPLFHENPKQYPPPDCRYKHKAGHHHDLVLASTHVHLEAHMCAEMVLTKGPARAIEEMANLPRQQKGVLHASLSLSSTGKNLA